MSNNLLTPNGQESESVVVVSQPKRPSNIWLIIVAALFIIVPFLTWYLTWFGRGLSDQELATYLSDQKNPRHMQHALLQIQQRLERGDQSAKQWYPQLISLSGNSETEFRLTVAWVMGFDNQEPQFHQALLKLVKDEQPIVRRNAALALVRFKDASGREELMSVLQPYAVKAPADGNIASTLKQGAEIARGALLARIHRSDGPVVELRSPLPGRINNISRPNDSHVAVGDEILTLNSDEGSVYEALRGLALIGQQEDLPAIEAYAVRQDATERVRQQAQLTVKAIQNRFVK